MEKYTRRAMDSTRIFTTHMTVNELKRAVTKATLDEETRPRMKDVNKIIDATFLRPSPHNSKCGPHKVLKYIQQRLRAGEWPVVLKALLLCHILLDEGSRGMIDILLRSPFIFNLQEFRDASNPSAYDFSSYSRLFGRYLQERIVTIRTLGAFYDTIRDPSRNQQTAVFVQENETIPSGQINTLDFREVLKVMPILENQLDVLTDVRLRAEELHNDLTIGVMERLMKDMLPLVNQLNQGVEMIQENFFTTSKSDCETSLKIYQTYVELVEKANGFLSVANRLGATESNVSLEHAPLDYLKGMAEHISTVSEDGKSSDTISEKRSRMDATCKSIELQKVASGDYNEEAALAAAIRASLQDSGSFTMIHFDNDSDEENRLQSDGRTLEESQEYSKAQHNIDDFFGIVSDSNVSYAEKNASQVSAKEQLSEKPKKKKGDDLLELLSDMNFSQQHHYSSGVSSSGQSLVPPMQVTNLSKKSSDKFSDSSQVPRQSAFQQMPQQPWHEVDTPLQFQNLQGYYSTIGSMNMMPMFPSQQGMIAPNMMMTPYMTYGGAGTWSGMPTSGYPSGMYMQYNSIGGWTPGTPAMQPIFYSPSYNSMGPRIPGTANSPSLYDSTHVEEISTHVPSINASENTSSGQVEARKRLQETIFGDLVPDRRTIHRIGQVDKNQK
ncbi:hypothetical protein GpartN1_g429.t1 [Galdieria partita]|uniref:ENTH domain-containing protein n=1 Tax=Galdieria partita TaxID=83374 RepID=A0A9C7PQC1_9RHOD|nr:hypothetical protein GpartN1_g429.t1 [Galdieria partita]